jgi:hypothetical protein
MDVATCSCWLLIVEEVSRWLEGAAELIPCGHIVERVHCAGRRVLYLCLV